MWYKNTMVNGKKVRLHRHLYEKAGGRIPKGWVVHHLNGNILDNRIANLVAVSRVTHSRLHSPNYTLQSDGWLKKCIVCKRLFDLSQFYVAHYPNSPPGGTPISRCKECERNTRNYYRRRRRNAS